MATSSRVVAEDLLRRSNDPILRNYLLRASNASGEKKDALLDLIRKVSKISTDRFKSNLDKEGLSLPNSLKPRIIAEGSREVRNMVKPKVDRVINPPPLPPSALSQAASSLGNTARAGLTGIGNAARAAKGVPGLGGAAAASLAALMALESQRKKSDVEKAILDPEQSNQEFIQRQQDIFDRNNAPDTQRYSGAEGPLDRQARLSEPPVAPSPESNIIEGPVPVQTAKEFMEKYASSVTPAESGEFITELGPEQRLPAPQIPVAPPVAVEKTVVVSHPAEKVSKEDKNSPGTFGRPLPTPKVQEIAEETLSIEGMEPYAPGTTPFEVPTTQKDLDERLATLQKQVSDAKSARVPKENQRATAQEAMRQLAILKTLKLGGG
jgi:hypothetical protein